MKMMMIVPSSSSRRLTIRRLRRWRNNTISKTTAALLLIVVAGSNNVVVHGADLDCETPDGQPYTGYSLKIGAGCREYVNCADGTVSTYHNCPPGLLFNGAVGSGGICDWAAVVTCATTDDDDAAAAAATTADADVTIDPTVPSYSSSSSTNTITTAATTIGSTTTSSSSPTLYCGTSIVDAADNCWMPCTGDGSETDCCPGLTCFDTSTLTSSSSSSSCANVDISGPNHNFCGTSWCDAVDLCDNAAPCPGGTDVECPVGQYCFADLPCDSGLDAPIVAVVDVLPSLVDGNDNDDDDYNPEHFFCGTSEADAAELCKPCPTGEMIECSDNFSHGCFRGITSCGGSGGDGSNSSSSTESNVLPTLVDNNVASGSVGGTNEDVTNVLGDNLNNIVNSYLNPNPVITPEGVKEEVVLVQPGSLLTPTTPAGEATPIPSNSPTLPPYTMAPFNPSPSSESKTIIGYYASWQWYDRNKLADPVNIDFTKYTRINFAFFQPDTQGNLYGTDEWADPQLLFGPYLYGDQSEENYRCSWDGPGATNCNYHDTTKGLLHLAQSQGVEVWPSIGGWTLSDNFPSIAADPVLREHFAQQCVDLIKAYGFDGIDIDWEYPGYKDHSGTPEDTENFTLFLRAIRMKLDELDGSYGLTAALPCGTDKIEDINVADINEYLTEFNLMSYDMHGSWDVLTGTNAPMYDQGWGDKWRGWSTHGCVDVYVGQGIPLSKINIGLSFYGRSYQKATGMKQFHGGADDINWHLDEGSPQYFNIVKELKRMTTYRHETTQTQYAVFNDGDRGMVSYDDARSICDKVQYANDRGLHGFLIWEISGDMIEMDDGQIVTPLIDATNAKIANPSYDCSVLRDPEWALSNQVYLYAPDEPDEVDWSNYIAPASTGSENDFNGAGAGGTMTTQEESVEGTETGSTPPDSSDSGTECPIDSTGYYPTLKCEGYVYCADGEMVGAVLPCVPGTLFDVTIGVCTWQDTVQCGSR